jgi:hypothetical protein
MQRLSNKFFRWVDEERGTAGLYFWCQGCEELHIVSTDGPHSWSWNRDAEKPVFSPSVLTSGYKLTPEGEAMLESGQKPLNGKYPRMETRCHTFVGCNGAQPGEVIFLSDCTHALAGQVLPFPDLPAKYLEDEAL